MNKFNKVKFCMLVVFIVLLFTSVQASSVALDEVTGNGMESDPYVIDVSGRSNKTIIFKYDKMPFYFVVKNGYEGTYEVSFEPVDKKVTFRFIESANENTSVMLDEAQYKDTKNWQIGVDTRLSSEVGVGAPSYNISEELEYYTSYEMYYMKEPAMFSDIFGDSITYLTSTDYVRMHKSTKLANVVINGSVAATKPNLYFFTTSTQKYEEAKKQLEAMGYISDSNYGLFDIFHNTKTNIEENREIYLANSYYGDNNTSTRILYKFNGNANTALNDTGEEVNVIESIITRMFLSVGDFFLNKMIRGVLGSKLSIDSLIFDRFEPTKLNLYSTRATGINKALRDVVNYWYKVLSNFTYIAYVIILVYIGIMAIISAGTDKQSKVRSNLTNWVVGLVIMLFLPTYGIPILFDLNKAMVTFMSKGTSKMETYYNVYDEEKDNDILGSDSATISIEELLALREGLQQDYEKDNSVREYVEKILKRQIKTEIKVSTGIEPSENDLNTMATLIDEQYNSFKYALDLGFSSGEAKLSSERSLKMTLHYGAQYGTMPVAVKSAMYKVLFEQGQWNDLVNKYLEEYESESKLESVDRLINIKQTDIMGMMRAYAGKYQRLVFAFIWLMLVFQLIGLAFLYFKRLFVIAILITIFPLIMLFYCIDKMNDGSAQTLSLWFKELLANIFIQSVHAVIYVLLIEMGLQIYINDPGNWILLVAAMLMILPAESIMKEIFGLNGSTLKAIGGAFMKTALAIGTVIGFSKALKGENDATVKDKNNKRFDRLQRRQNRADAKARTRAAKRAGDRTNYDALTGKRRYTEDNLVGWDKRREQLYHLGTDIRKFRAKAAPAIDATLRHARNNAALAAGLLYGAAGGDIESMAQGAQITKALSGKTKNLSDEDMKIKTELKAAYNRKKEEE